MARNCYEEVCRMAPQSSYGILAAGQLEHLSRQAARSSQSRDAGETQAAPPARTTGNDEEQAVIDALYRMADQLRRQTQEEPTCPFRPGQSPRPDKPVNNDDSMSDTEAQEMLDSAQFLETFLDDLAYPEGAEEDTNADGNSGVKPDQDESGDLTIAPAPRSLIIVVETEHRTQQWGGKAIPRRRVKEELSTPSVITPVGYKP
jgi:hypothetical protein